MNPIKMTSSQKRYSSLYKNNPDTVLNNLTFSLKIEGQLDIEKFITALKVVLSNRALLNSTCDLDNFQYLFQEFDHEIRINLIDIPLLEDPNQFVVEQAREQNNLSFNVQNDPLYRITVLRKSNNLAYLTLTFIHTIADGIGIHYFIKDVFSQYECELDNISSLNLGENNLSLRAESELNKVNQNLDVWWNQYFSQSSLEFGHVSEFEQVGQFVTEFKILEKFSLNMFTSKLLEILIKADTELKLAVNGSYFIKEVLGNRDHTVKDFNCYIDLIPYIIIPNIKDSVLLDNIIHNRQKAKENKIPYWDIVENVSNTFYSHPYGIANIEINVRFLEFGPKFGNLDLTTSILKESLFQTGGIMSDICLVADCFDKSAGTIALYYNKSRFSPEVIKNIFKKMLNLINGDYFFQKYTIFY